jgi:hypothetical protein
VAGATTWFAQSLIPRLNFSTVILNQPHGEIFGGPLMPLGTLDIMKLDGQPVTYQIMFEQNAGGTFVARVDSDELVPFMHEEMRVDLPVAESAGKRVQTDGRVRLPGIFLEENNLHAIMEYLEEDI